MLLSPFHRGRSEGTVCASRPGVNSLDQRPRFFPGVRFPTRQISGPEGAVDTEIRTAGLLRVTGRFVAMDRARFADDAQNVHLVLGI